MGNNLNPANREKVSRANSKLCGPSATMACYTSDGWHYDPAKVIAELEAVIAMLRDTVEDGRSPWEGKANA
jgi:hypothetical protein